MMITLRSEQVATTPALIAAALLPSLVLAAAVVATARIIAETDSGSPCVRIVAL